MDYFLLADRPSARRRARANISPSGRGGTRWAFSLPGFWLEQRRWPCRSICICCGGTRSNPQPFSSLMFFEQRTQSSIKHRRLRYLLLLALRLALLAAVGARFRRIRSSIAPRSAHAGDKLVLLVVDNSFSMRAGSRLADAKREAASVLASRKPAERAQVMALGSQLQVLTQPTQDAAALRAAVEQHRARRLARQFRRARARAAFRGRERRHARSSCISSATCRSPTCRRISPSWRCPPTSRSSCIPW